MPSDRFDGAITTPQDGGEVPDQSIPPPPERPGRPILVEISAAILIVGGITSLLSDIGYQVGGGDTGALGLLVSVLNVLTIVVGILIRSGRAWVLSINVVAIALFLELTALPTTFGIIFSTLDAIVLFTLFRHRAWFDWKPPATGPDGHGLRA
jgi:hypothetical protein